MTDRKFTNNYDIIVWALALLLQLFHEEDMWFAALYKVWWLASII